MSTSVHLRRVLVGALVLLSLAGCDEQSQFPPPAGGGPAAGSAPVSAPGVPAQGSDALEPAQQLTLSGSAAGVFTTASEVRCSHDPGTSDYSWNAKGPLNGSPLEVDFTTQSYRGPGSYNVTGITDAHGGQMTLQVGSLQSPGHVLVASDGATRGMFTFADDEKSGTMDVELKGNDGQHVRLTGSWKC